MKDLADSTPRPADYSESGPERTEIEYVGLAKAGETVLVAERDEIVAELRPVRRQAPLADRLDDLLDGLAAAGEITRAGQPKGDWTGAVEIWGCRQDRPRAAG